MSRLRWKLARWFAPVPILASPGEDEGAYILIRGKPGRYSMLAWVKAATFDMKLDTPLQPLHFDTDHYMEYPSQRTSGRFSGTVGADA